MHNRKQSFFIGLFALCLLAILVSCGTSSPAIQPASKAEPTSAANASDTNTEDTSSSQETTEAETVTATVAQTETATLPPEPTPTSEPMSVADIDMQAGKVLYSEVCAACHGLNAKGIDGIGVNLTTSTFVVSLDEIQLTEFLIRGLSITNPFNTTNVKMPPRGGREELSNQEMLNIAAYLQSINIEEPNPEDKHMIGYLQWIEEGGEDYIQAMPAVGNDGITGEALEGQTTYLRFCAVCHGPNAEGVETLGKGFRGSDFIPMLSDKELAEFLEQGRSSDDPLNETGIEMLPYGGQPYLTDDQVTKLVAYMRAVAPLEPVPAVLADAEHPEPVKSSREHEELEAAAFQIIEEVTPRCFSCHLISERGNKNGPGPHLNGLSERAADRVPGLSAEEYVLQSIMDPGTYMVEECPRGPCVDVMVKNYNEKLNEDQLDILVSFLLSLPTDQELMIAQEELEDDDERDDDERDDDERDDDERDDDERDDDERDDDERDDDERDDDERDDDERDDLQVQDRKAVEIRAVDLLGAWVDEGAINGEFTFTDAAGNTYVGDFENNILPLFVTPGIWYTDSESCINCHYEQSEDSDHEMDLGTYKGILEGADVISSPPGVPIINPGDWENSVLRNRLRNTRMPPDPGWEWDHTEENRDGPTLTISEGEVRAVDLLGEWVNQGAEAGEFSFESIDGESYLASFDEHVLPLFTEPDAWYADSLPCTDCHYEQSEDSDHEMDLSSHAGILAGADVVSSPPGVPIVIPGDWDNSVLRSRLRDTRMPPSPGWEWDRTEENRDGPTLSVVPKISTHRIVSGAEIGTPPVQTDETDEDEASDDEELPKARAVDLLSAWVDEGAINGEFTFTDADGNTYVGDFENNILPLFVTPGIWYEDSEACINCHYEQSEDSDHEMDLSTYKGILEGADVISSPPGVPIIMPGDWENSVLRNRLRNTRMPPDPGWEWDITEENRDGPTLTISEGEVRAVDLLGAWVNQGAEEGEFSFESIDGESYLASFEEHVLPLFTEPDAWYADSLPCTDCHYEQSEDSDHEMDLSSHTGILAGADVVSSPPGVPIVIPGDWDNSVLRSRMRDARMPPSPGWEWDRTEENRDGPMLVIDPKVSTERIGTDDTSDETDESDTETSMDETDDMEDDAAETDDTEDEDAPSVRAVDLIGAWVDEGAINGEFTFTGIDGNTYIGNFENDILPLFIDTGAWYEDSEACINCHYEQSEDSDHEMDLSTYEGILEGADVISSPPGVPIIIPGDWENSVLRSRLRDTRMPPDPGWEWDPTEENRDGPTLTISEGEVRAVDLLGAWVDQGAETGEFSFEGIDGESYLASFEEHVLPLFTEPDAWYADSLPCTDCHYEQSEDSDHEMDMSTYEGILAGADVISSPPGVPIIIPGDWDNSVLRSRLRDTRMPPSPGWEWDITEENRDGPTVHIPQP